MPLGPDVIRRRLESCLGGPPAEQHQGLASLEAEIAANPDPDDLLAVAPFISDPRLLVPDNVLKLLVRLGAPDPGAAMLAEPSASNPLGALAPLLAHWTQHQDPRVRGRSCAALAWCLPPGAEADAALAKAMDAERYDDCRAMQALALGIVQRRKGNRDHAERLLRCYERAKVQVRWMAAAGLAFADPHGPADVRASLRDLAESGASLILWIRDLPGPVWLASVALAVVEPSEAVDLVLNRMRNGLRRGEAFRTLTDLGSGAAAGTRRGQLLGELAGLAPFSSAEAEGLRKRGLPDTPDGLRAIPC